MLCRNLLSKASRLVDEDGDDVLTCSLIHESELDFASDSDVRGSVRRLAAKRLECGPGEFSKWSQAIGFTHQPHNLLLDRSLDDVVSPLSQFRHDWMHAAFAHGVWNSVACWCLEAFIAAGVKDIWDHTCTYVGNWWWPSRVHSPVLKDMFCKKRAKSSRTAHHLKCTASEGLSVLTVFSFFVRVVLLRTGKCPWACKAVLALADVVDLLMSVPLGNVQPDQLRLIVSTLLGACCEAGWRELMHPKFHWLVHLPRHLETFHCLPTCWVHERKHRVVKRYANDICNNVSFERSVLGEVTSHHVASISKPDAFNFKVGFASTSRAAPASVVAVLNRELSMQLEPHECKVSTHARISAHSTCHKGDVVMYTAGRGFLVGRVCFHAKVFDDFVTLLSAWPTCKLCPEAGSAECNVHHGTELVETADIMAALVNTECRPGVVRVLIPFQFRHLL